jgi:ABC-type sugar transport system substrate-binding protein
LFDTKNDKENKIGLDGPCKTMAMDDKSIYLGGNFKEAGTVHAKSIVRYMNVRMKR